MKKIKPTALFKVLLISSLVIASCQTKKDAGYCYQCEITGPAYHRVMDTCSSSPSSTYQFEDASGNTLGFFCREQ